MEGNTANLNLNFNPGSSTNGQSISPNTQVQKPATLDDLSPTQNTTQSVTQNSSVGQTGTTSEKVFAIKQPVVNQNNVAKEKQAFTTYEKKAVKKSNGSDDDYFEEGPGFPVSVSSLFITVFGGLSVLFYFTYSYISVASQVTIAPEDQPFVAQVRSWEETVTRYIPINQFNYYNSLSFDTMQARQDVDEIVASKDLNYIHKRDLTNKAVGEIAKTITKEKEAINTVRRDIAEYGFFDLELAKLMESDKNNTSIQDSLSSLETVRFATAIKVFSFLDNFTAPFIRQSGKSKEYVTQQLKLYVERGEVDIANYLKTCRNNPFERVDNCSIINDFRNYFTYIEPREDFDIDLFLQLVSLADQKLEEEEFPSLSLLFDRFNPNSQKLSFTVNVNTTSYDRAQLQAVGIFAPQVFIITNLVNLLKQSKFVLGSDININKLEVQKKNINIGGNTEQIYTSTMRFELPLQKSTQREIFDFEFKENIDNITQTFNLDLDFTLPSGENVETSLTGELTDTDTTANIDEGNTFTIETIAQ